MRKRLASLAAAVLLVAVFAAPSPAAQQKFAFVFDGPSENPPNGSLGTGTGTAIYDDVAGTLALTATFAGMSGNVTQTHFHGTTTVSGLASPNPFDTAARRTAAAAVPNAGIAIGNTTLPGFPLGVNNGAYSNTLNLNDPSIYNTGFLSANGGSAANARATFITALTSGRTYWNIHSSQFGGGEMRAFPIPVPEPAVAGLAASAIGLVLVRRRRS
jgi:hypothetical protein